MLILHLSRCSERVPGAPARGRVRQARGDESGRAGGNARGLQPGSVSPRSISERVGARLKARPRRRAGDERMGASESLRGRGRGGGVLVSTPLLTTSNDAFDRGSSLSLCTSRHSQAALPTQSPTSASSPLTWSPTCVQSQAHRRYVMVSSGCSPLLCGTSTDSATPTAPVPPRVEGRPRLVLPRRPHLGSLTLPSPALSTRPSAGPLTTSTPLHPAGTSAVTCGGTRRSRSAPSLSATATSATRERSPPCSTRRRRRCTSSRTRIPTGVRPISSL